MKINHCLGALALLATALLGGPAQAAQTSIAQVPLLNMTGTGTVKPNLMLLFDNSGSMDWAFLPDSVGYGSTYQCRTAATLAAGASLCSPGHPPFMSPDFNKQYYNPAIRYQVPIKSDGSYYPQMTAANTSNWTAVTGDGFNAHKTDLAGASASTVNLATGFPDLKWCTSTSGTSCQVNTAAYTYPDGVYNSPITINSNPYYYTIEVAQYCSDKNLTNCVSTSVGAAAPTGYPYPAKVRWCDTVNLTNCQAKQVGNFKYPSFSTPLGAQVAFGTIAVRRSTSASSMTITSVTIPDPSTQRTITNGTITAATGVDTALKQQTVASAIAASINAKSGLTNQYWACVRTPVGTTNVSPCSSYGITLASDNIVAVIPIFCNPSTKSATNCSVLTDASRNGWGITVNAPTVTVTPAVAPVPATALVQVSGTTGGGGTTPSLASITWGGTTVGSSISLGKNSNAATAVSKIVGAIGTGGTITAYVGGNNVTPACAAKSNTWLCLVHTAATSNVGTPSFGSVTNAGTIAFAPSAGTGYSAGSAAVTDSIATDVAAITGGSAAASTFRRVDILNNGSTYPRAVARTDCVTTAGVCTFTEEMVNFANWFAYYKTRIQMAKSAVGQAFAPVSGNYRVGLARMSNVGAGGAIDLVPADFAGTARDNWYTTFYATTTSGSTPTRPSIDNVGRMYANLSPYNYPAGSEVVQYPCQQNFILLTTDGYWNGGSSSNVSNNDNVENASRFCTAGRGCVDTRTQSPESLADVTLHWYNGGSSTGTVSLRPGLEDMTKPGLVPAGAGENTHLHVTTFTMGLGMDGVMNYEPNYDTAPAVGGDFFNLITQASTGCPWNGGGAYIWPDPQVGSSANTVQERVDDLWHAAINGHGKYFSANDPASVQAGLAEAISNISVRVGAASAAATSTPNISQQDNDIFSDVFTTGKWYGELADKKIDIATGIVGTTATWTTTDKLGLTVGASSDTRTIWMLDPAGTRSLKEFKYSEMSASPLLKGWFDNKCTLLPQCSLLSQADKDVVNNGDNIVNWLRGQQQYADDHKLRAYTMTTPATGTAIPIVLGDIASSKPAFLRGPDRQYSTAGYSTFKSANAGRAATVFTAANDGMLHAFDARTGDERWAYVPRITMKKLYSQASINYGLNHQFTTDGSPELNDVQIGGVWKTVLVAGLNGGGRGFYALDVTDPATPVALWELCADPAVCAKNDPDIGLTFGNPQFGMWRGQWVVYLTSGYNNVSGVDGVSAPAYAGTGVTPGDNGQGYLYIVDIATGNVLKKVSTGAGSKATPSGLAKITSISLNPFTDPVTTYIYGGDNDGQMWRFDLTTAAPAEVPVVKIGTAVISGTVQPITTRPEVTQCEVVDVVNGVSTRRAQRAVIFGTGRLLDLSDTSTTGTQSLYMVKDTGSPIANIRSASMVQQTLSLQGSSSNTNTYAITNNAVNLSTKDGWYVDWTLNPGERMNLDPQIVAGGVNVVTTMPTSSSSCSVGGSSNVYQFNVCTGAAVASNSVAGGTLSTNSAAVGFIIVRLPSGTIKMITTTASGNNITTNVTPPSSMEARKTGWRRVSGE
ncbi:PilC/PilY family type IV pilus protein [Massilia sp. R2A-15]|uniref:pilus assembly protein n=1 Tax=Massilia sp. R2A-15 TaxID=3064278 RepID=UPI002735F59B|nr:PilC/PilY family type IV pilus protein [Massilia sp. R2A-15]WLI91490.1 PilC/PilY family type IV pilus protein [Massilia sp. R2A-15]